MQKLCPVVKYSQSKTIFLTESLNLLFSARAMLRSRRLTEPQRNSTAVLCEVLLIISLSLSPNSMCVIILCLNSLFILPYWSFVCILWFPFCVFIGLLCFTRYLSLCLYVLLVLLFSFFFFSFFFFFFSFGSYVYLFCPVHICFVFILFNYLFSGFFSSLFRCLLVFLWK